MMTIIAFIGAVVYLAHLFGLDGNHDLPKLKSDVSKLKKETSSIDP